MKGLLFCRAPARGELTILLTGTFPVGLWQQPSTAKTQQLCRAKTQPSSSNSWATGLRPFNYKSNHCQLNSCLPLCCYQFAKWCKGQMNSHLWALLCLGAPLLATVAIWFAAGKGYSQEFFWKGVPGFCVGLDRVPHAQYTVHQQQVNYLCHSYFAALQLPPCNCNCNSFLTL